MTPFRVILSACGAVVGLGLTAADVAAQYTTQTASLDVGGVNRSYLLARPEPMPATPLPLVISMHGHGGDSAGMRAALPLELAAGNAGGHAVFVYPKSAGSGFDAESSTGRAHESQLVRQLIALLHGTHGIDRRRVYLVGFSTGATMANVLGCRLGRGVIGGVGIHSGILYPRDGDFSYTPDGGVDCALPPAIIVWGDNDKVLSVSAGMVTRNFYLTTHRCRDAVAVDPVPCAGYQGCAHGVRWCAVSDLGHSIWGGFGAAPASAATAIWNFIADTMPDTIFVHGFQGWH